RDNCLVDRQRGCTGGCAGCGGGRSDSGSDPSRGTRGADAGRSSGPQSIRAMMRLWLSKNSAASLREQLGTQLTLGVISGDLKPGEKLPSVRELARRYNIHSNTVSAAYRDVE